MIDIHSHILPGLDDGAHTLEESVDMLRMAAAAGTTDIVATPHSDQRYKFDPEAVRRGIEELQLAAGASPRVHYGCELHVTFEGIGEAMRCPENFTLARRGYVLTEFPDTAIPRTSRDILTALIARGMRPIVAHPERNIILRRQMEELEAWVELGCVLQVTSQSLLGRFGKSAEASARDLMERGMVHFLASDAHDLKHRPPVLDEVWQYVETTFGVETARKLMVENPRAVLDGLPIAHQPATERRKKWYSLW